MQRITHREYRVWEQHFADDLETPSRSDFYLMQVAREVHTVLMKNSGGVKLQDFLLRVKKEPKTAKPLPEKVELQKAIWRRRIGIKNGG